MSTQHTPGPWTLETVPTTCGVCHKVGPFPGKRDSDKPRHACLYSDYPSAGNPSDAELLANARLIAAAPELLNIAERLSLATNEGEDASQGTHYVDRDGRIRCKGSFLALIEDARAAIAKATGGAA